MTSSPVNATGLLDTNSARTVVLAAKMTAPDSMTMYTEYANRLVEDPVKEAIVRPIHQRRATIAPVTDALRVNTNANADIMREVVTEPYTPSYGKVDAAKDA